MNYKLAKKLKDAGFPQGMADWYTQDGQYIPEEEREYFPTLSELIEACGDKYKGSEFALWKEVKFWFAGYKNWDYEEIYLNPEGKGSTPEEAVANLWLKLNKTVDN